MYQPTKTKDKGRKKRKKKLTLVRLKSQDPVLHWEPRSGSVVKPVRLRNTGTGTYVPTDIFCSFLHVPLIYCNDPLCWTAEISAHIFLLNPRVLKILTELLVGCLQFARTVPTNRQVCLSFVKQLKASKWGKILSYFF